MYAEGEGGETMKSRNEREQARRARALDKRYADLCGPVIVTRTMPRKRTDHPEASAQPQVQPHLHRDALEDGMAGPAEWDRA